MNSNKALVTALLVSMSITTAYAGNGPNNPGNTESWKSDDKPLAFNEVNEQLHTNYNHAKDEIKQTLGPIIICTNDSISLLKGKDKTTIPFIKPHYTGLKEVAHITLGTFILLTNHTDEILTADKIETLKQYKAAIEKAAPKVHTEEAIEKSEDARQDELIKKTLTFLDQVIADKRVLHADLTNYVRSTTQPDLQNAYGAAGSQIATMDEAVTKWHKEMTAEEWSKLYVIIATTHMPRNQLVSWQYFSKLLNQPEEGKQIIVSEGFAPGTDDQLIDLLLTHILDGKVAVEFFNDPWRMHRDLLSDGAKKYLQEHQIKGNAM